jgi:hypothetical protein
MISIIFKATSRNISIFPRTYLKTDSIAAAANDLAVSSATVGNGIFPIYNAMDSRVTTTGFFKYSS